MVRVMWPLGGCILALASLSYTYTFGLSRAAPEAYSKDFTATGLVENIHFARFGRGCVVDLAVYRWVNLSIGFSLVEIPQRGQRYQLEATDRDCQVVQVAMAASEGHIFFKAAELLRRPGTWKLAETPQPALGCGGRLTDWVPGFSDQ